MGSKSDISKSENHWSRGLLISIKDPKLIILEDDLTVTIKDVYPKARFHYLVCPKEEINSLRNVKLEHVDLLKHMHLIAKKLSRKHEGSNFLIGYHSVPSMIRLHLHVISDDFDSPCLKTKKHWNSFTTEFFTSSKFVISELESKGKINHKSVAECKALIDQPLKCHKCCYKPKHMPDLKQHLKVHLK